MTPNNNTAAICGLFCGTCHLYPEKCHGCLSDKLTASCVTCANGFRDCVKKHNVTRCFECVEFPCGRLEDFSKQHWENGICHHADVITDLQFMKDHSVGDWVTKKTADNTCQKCGKLVYWHDKNRHSCVVQ